MRIFHYTNVLKMQWSKDCITTVTLVHVGFLHNSEELRLTYFTITIFVCFIYHFLGVCECDRVSV